MSYPYCSYSWLSLLCDDIEGCNDRLRLKIKRVTIQLRASLMGPDKKPLRISYLVNPRHQKDRVDS